MIKFEDVSKSYLGGFQAIQKVSFRVNQGEMVYLRGHSGAGKSSLLKLIAAIERPTLGNTAVRIVEIILILVASTTILVQRVVVHIDELLSSQQIGHRLVMMTASRVEVHAENI